MKKLEELEYTLQQMRVGETMDVGESHMVVVTEAHGDISPCKLCYYKRNGMTRTGCSMLSACFSNRRPDGKSVFFRIARRSV